MIDHPNTGLIDFITVYNHRLKVYHAINKHVSDNFLEDVKSGLTSTPKYLLPKYFYDSKGSELFELICDTPEYYVTRTEAEILRVHSEEIAALSSDKEVIVELGSGSSVKTRYLLNSFLDNRQKITYMPIDVSEILISSSEEILNDFEGVKIDGVLSEYETGLNIAGSVARGAKLFVFLGSSIGNFRPGEARSFINHVSQVMNERDSLLIGFDMVKDVNVLNAAYNDAQGITAKFNINLLNRINSELAGEFDTDKFEHKAFFNENKSRIEMHIVSKDDQDVCIHGIRKEIHFDKGETIHTENSYKYTDEMINSLAESSGLRVEKTWKDPKDYFALCMMKKSTD